MFKKIIIFLVISLLFLSKNLILTNYNQIGPKTPFMQISQKIGDNDTSKELIKDRLDIFGSITESINIEKLTSSKDSDSPYFGNQKLNKSI